MTHVLAAPSTPEAAPPKPAEKAEEAGRPPTRELLPRGTAAALVATAGVALAIVSFVDFGASGRALVGAVFCPMLVLVAAIDFKHQLLPNDILWPAALLIGLIVAASNPGAFLTHLAAAAALGGFLIASGLVVRGGIGMGDAKLGFVLGLALGTRTLSAMMVAFAGLLLAALWVLARQGLSARKQAIPFGPFLALGGILAFFLG